MFLQHMKLTVAVAAATGFLAVCAAQAQTPTQNPPPAKPNPQMAAPPPAQAPQEPPPVAGRAMRPPRGRMGQGMGQGRPMGGMMGNPQARGRQVRRPMVQLNLTQEQKDQRKALQQQQQKDMQAVRERMTTARQKLQETMKADIPDEAAVKSAAGVLAAVQAEQFALQARAKAQTMKLLTPEQQSQLKAFRDRGNQVRQRQMQRNLMLQRRDMMGRGMRQNQMAPGRGPMRGPMWRQPPIPPGTARRWRGWI